LFRYAATIFLSAFLLFQVQPLISKYILPWFGGIPTVWTMCMLFFQVVLLAGYSYAHGLNTWLSRRKQIVVHLVLLGVAALVLLFVMPPSGRWKPQGGDDPTWRILALLAASVGLPYFMLSTTGPLLQAWFSRSFPGRSPYRLYSLSNVGSLLALVTFPFLVEPQLTLTSSSQVWKAGFVLFALLCAYVGWRIWDLAPAEADPAGLVAVPVTPDVRPGLLDRFLWLGLPACGSMLLLATTSKICQDVAVVPFLWIIPLGLYLLSFIICFDNERWYFRPVFWPLYILLTAGMVWLLYRGVNSSVKLLVQDLQDACAAVVGRVNQDLSWKLQPPNLMEKVLPFKAWAKVTASIQTQIVGYAAGLFVCCMVCHGELVRLKPSPKHLTSFYLMVSLGGALGGVFVGMVAPHIFQAYLEFHIALLGSLAFGAAALWISRRRKRLAAFASREAVRPDPNQTAIFAGVCVAVTLLCALWLILWAPRRSWYGTWAFFAWGLGALLVLALWSAFWDSLLHARKALATAEEGQRVPSWDPLRWITFLVLGTLATAGVACIVMFWASTKDWYAEWRFVVWGIAIAYVVALWFNLKPGRPGWPAWWARIALPLFLAALVILGEFLRNDAERSTAHSLALSRNFYGILRVAEYGKNDPEYHHLTLANGRISHGWQLTSAEGRLRPVSYFAPASGVGLTFANYPRNGKGLRVGVLGLGVGTFAAYGQAGDHFTFYEINPECDRLAGLWKDEKEQEGGADADDAKPGRKRPPTPARFTYLRDLKSRNGEVDVRIGDGRLTLERELAEGKPQGFDILALDAFSSDAVPVHLLTKEAFDIYLKHMKPDGVILVNITNRYIDLRPVVDSLAAALNKAEEKRPTRGEEAGEGEPNPRPWRTALIEYDGEPPDYMLTCCSWMLVTRNAELLDCEPIQHAVEQSTGHKPRSVRFWTDDFSNLYEILRWK